MTEQNTTTAQTELIERMFDAGAHFGYSRSRRHPSVAPYIFGVKNKVEIFDLEKTSAQLTAAKEAMREFSKQKKKVLFVGGKNEARGPVREMAQELGMPYVAGRWIGGTLSNFSEIKKRIERLKELTHKREKGEFETKYTKLERLMIDREIDTLKLHFEGLIPMEGVPQALCIIDVKNESAAVAEAKKKKLPIVGLLNSDSDMTDIAHPIVANDATQKSIRFFVSELGDAYREGMKAAA